MKKLQITDSKVTEAIVLYKAGKAVRPICDELHIDSMVLRRFLKELGILRTRGEAIRGGKSEAVIKDDVLDILTSDALYWIGFLYADGHIEKDRPRVALTIGEKDKSHLDKFRQFFGDGILVRQVEIRNLKANGYYSNPAFRVEFSSKKICNKLISLGFTNRKTWDITPHDFLKNSRDFWRGVVDGDGWIFRTKTIGVGICGHENTVAEFLAYINRAGVSTETKGFKSKKRDFLWQCELHQNKATSTLKILYENATTYLDRKYQKYLEITQTI